MIDSVYKVKVTDIFEGPMDLLIHLIKKNEVDIYDIPIGIITEQYLTYIEWMKAMNIDFAGDFLVMASTLTQIKSKMLLPTHEFEVDEEEDPRLAITRPLLEYLQIKSAAEDLADRQLLGVDTFIRPQVKSDQILDPEDELIKIGLFELIDAFQNILKNLAPEHRLDFSADRISVNDRISELVDKFERKPSLTFDELFDGNITKEILVVTFLAILEMVRLNLLQMAQHSQTGIIRLFYQ